MSVIGRLTLLTAVLALPCAALGAAPLDDVDLSSRDARNLQPLVALFRDGPLALPGELAEFARSVGQAESAPAARLLLRQLIPVLARHRALQQRPWARRLPRTEQRRANRSGPRPPGTAVFGERLTLPLSAVEPRRLSTAWLQGTWETARQNDRDGVDGFDSDARGLMLGFEREISPGLTLGIAGGPTRADVTTPGRGRDRTDADDYQAYSRITRGHHQVEILVSDRVSDTDRERVLRVPRDGSVRVLRLFSSVESDELLLSVGWRYDLEFDGGWYLEPGLDLSRLRLDTDDYVESGGGELGLAVHSEDESQLTAAASLSAGRFVAAGEWDVAAGISLGLERVLDADETVTTSTFTGTRFGFTSRGYSVAENSASAALTLAAYHASGLGVSVGVSHQRQNDYRDTAITFSLEATF